MTHVLNLSVAAQVRKYISMYMLAQCNQEPQLRHCPVLTSVQLKKDVQILGGYQ